MNKLISLKDSYLLSENIEDKLEIFKNIEEKNNKYFAFLYKENWII